jgi:hypothetical protein
MEQVHHKKPCLDQKGIDALFDRFHTLGDRVRKIACGGRRLLKPFLDHRCFERVRYRVKRDDDGELLKGHLFDAEVCTSVRLETNHIHVLGVSETEPPVDAPATPIQPQHSFELVFSQ